MNNLTARVRRFLVSEDGPTAVEYAVMLSLIIVACATVITSLATQLKATFTSVTGTLSGS
jgi:pilus assembly protein Flp/PilA